MKETESELHQKKQVTLWGAIINLLLAGLKIVVGIFGHSQSLVADGVHSLSDLATDGMVYLAAHHAHQEADEEHPYGHARFETLATVGLGLLLVVVASAILWDAVNRMLHVEKLLQPGFAALVVALVSIASKEMLYRWTKVVARRTRSKMMEANAWHHRSDAISSVVVLLGIAGNMLGFIYLDAIAAGVVGVMVAMIGLKLIVDASRELVDEALDAERVEKIRSKIMTVPGVRELHFLRTRTMGANALVDVHILVNPMISVSEGHHVSERVRKVLIHDVEEVYEVTVHIDPEDDETGSPSDGLPLREELMHQLDQVWHDMPERLMIKKINLHYLGGKIRIEVVLPLTLLETRPKQLLVDQFEGAAKTIGNISDVQVLFV